MGASTWFTAMLLNIFPAIPADDQITLTFPIPEYNEACVVEASQYALNHLPRVQAVELHCLQVKKNED